MAAPKSNKISKILNSLQWNGRNAQSKIPDYTSDIDQQEINLDLSLGGSYNGKTPNETPMPQPFSSTRASTVKNPAFQRAMETIRSDIHNISQDTSEIYDNGDSSIKSNTGKGKLIVFAEGNGEKSLKKVEHSHNVVTLMDTSDLLKIMPGLTISGGIINGEQIEGILYSFGQDKQVSIVCVCHGRFFTPAEFVKHGGGEEFDNPMKYIKIAYNASVGNV